MALTGQAASHAPHLMPFAWSMRCGFFTSPEMALAGQAQAAYVLMLVLALLLFFVWLLGRPRVGGWLHGPAQPA